MLSKTIRKARLQRGWSQADLARYVGVSPAAVSIWEGGHCEPRLDRLRALAKLFDCEVGELIAGRL